MPVRDVRAAGDEEAENRGSVLGDFGVWPGLVDLNEGGYGSIRKVHIPLPLRQVRVLRHVARSEALAPPEALAKDSRAKEHDAVKA